VLAAGLAFINSIERSHLIPRAQELGQRVLDRVTEIAEASRFIGDVRGKGLYVGAEFVRDKETKEPAPDILEERPAITAKSTRPTSWNLYTGSETKPQARPGRGKVSPPANPGRVTSGASERRDDGVHRKLRKLQNKKA
jgi:hypothetical protein